MVRDHAVFVKVPFIVPGCYNGPVGDRNSSDGYAGFGEGFLDADAKICSIVPVSDSQHIAAQIDQRMFCAFTLQIVFQPVGDVAFGDPAQVDPCLRVGEGDCIPVYPDAAVINMSDRL